MSTEQEQPFTDLDSAIDAAHSAATSSFERKKVLPMGWVWLDNLDGRKKLARHLKDDERFTVHSANDSVYGPSGTHVSIDAIGGQSIPAKRDAYSAFLDTLQTHGFAEDARVYAQMD